MRITGICSNLFVFFLIFSINISAAVRTASVTGNWSNMATWGNQSVPIAGDDVYINNGINVTVNVAANCASLTINGGGAASYVTLTNTLNVTGAIIINAGTVSGANKYINVNNSTLTCSSVSMSNTANSNRDCYIQVNTGTVNIAGNLIMLGNNVRNQFVFVGSGTLNIGGNLTGGTLSNTAGSSVALTRGTVNYYGADQNVAIHTHFNVITSGSGVKTATNTLNVNGSLTVNSNTTLNLSTFSLLGTLTAITNSGEIQTQSTSATHLPAGRSWDGTVRYNNLTGGQSIRQGTYTNLIIDNTSGIQTASGAIAANGIFSTAEGGTLNMVTNSLLGNMTTLSSLGTIRTQNTTTTPISAGKTWGGTIIFDGTTSAQTIPEATFNDLTINNSFGTTLNANVTVSNQLTLSAGLVTLGVNHLTLGASALEIAGAPFSSSKMIVASGTGEVRKVFSANGSYLFPIGDATGTVEYSPITLTFSNGTYAGGAYVAARVTNTKHPNNSSVTNFLNRYWTVSQSGVTSFVADVSANYVGADISGVESGQVAARYTGNLPWVKYAILGLNTLTANSLTSFGDFTGINNTPTISTDVSSLSSFTYPANGGPSSILSFNVTGSDLAENVVIYPSTSFEISASNGALFSPQPFVSISPVGGSISSQPVYVRMKAGLSQGAIASENISVTTTGATSVNVACSGTVTVQPAITVTAISGTFGYTYKTVNTAERTFTVTGSNLEGDIIVTAPENYEISTTTGSGFGSTPITLTRSGSTLPAPNPRTIYVRLKTGLGVGSYNENITCTSTYADNKLVALTGAVNPIATLTTSTSWLAGFIYTQGAGPSQSQTFTLNGSSLTSVVTITPPTDFELSTNGTTWNTSAFTIAHTGGVVNQLIYARLRSARTVATYGPQNISLQATGAVIKTVALNGLVVSTPTIAVSKNSLSGFGYLFNSGPSQPQAFTVSGAALTNNITITPPANFEISLSPTTGYQNTPLVIAKTGDTIAARSIYVRLPIGLSATDYTGSISLTSTNATTKTVALTAKVFATPLISTSGGGTYCLGETINLTSTGNDVQSRFWTGPNDYYSTSNNVSLTNATQSLSGNYTVTGNVIVGGNLIVNGDFEYGNVGFGSSYSYVTPAANALQPEDLYTIVALASSVHSNFNSIPDHSAAPGTLQMVINGYRTAGVVVWSQSVPVVAGANYEFSYWLQTVVNGTDPAPSKLQLYVNGEMAGPVYTANPTSGIWTRYIYNTSSISNSVLNLELINQTTVASGNDFALDDIEFRQVLSATSTENVNVTPSVTASVNVTYSPTNVYQNTPVVFTATPVNGGETPAYKWFVGGFEQFGQVSSTFSYTPTSLGPLTVSCEMTTSIKCAAPKPATDTEVVTVQTQPANYWMGYLDTDWGKPANWTAGYIPSTGDNVVYATVANFGEAARRDLQLDINRTIGSLINATVKRLIIPVNLTLSCNNTVNVTPPVTNPVTNSEDLILIQASTTLPNGSLIYKNPVNSPAYGTVEMYSPASWNTGGGLNNVYNWQYFGIPLASLPALPTFYGAYVRQLLEHKDKIENHWESLTNESVLIPFKGYELCQINPNTFYTFKGQLVNSNYNSGQLVKTTTGNPLYPGQHLFANPYTSAIDIRQIEFGTNTESTAYLYNTGTFLSWQTNPVKSTFTSLIPGQYTAVPKNQAGSDFEGNPIPRQVPSMGTFMVRVLLGQPSTAQSFVALNYNTVAMGNTDRQRVKANSLSDEQVATTIEVEGEFGADKMWIMTHENYTRGFDDGYDGYKMIGTALNPQLYAVEKDGNYQINSVDDINNTTLAFQAGQDTEYKLTFKHDVKMLQKYDKILLHDLVENRVLDITHSGTEYVFNAVSTSGTQLRFKILAQKTETADNEIKSFKAYSFDNKIYVQNFSENAGVVSVYDISGKTVGIKPIRANENIQFSCPEGTIFIVKATIGNNDNVSKIYLK